MNWYFDMQRSALDWWQAHPALYVAALVIGVAVAIWAGVRQRI